MLLSKGVKAMDDYVLCCEYSTTKERLNSSLHRSAKADVSFSTAEIHSMPLHMVKVHQKNGIETVLWKSNWFIKPVNLA